MKTIRITLIIIAVLLGGIFWIQWEQRSRRMAEQKQSEIQAESQSNVELLQMKIGLLHKICDDRMNQWRLLHNQALYDVFDSNKMEQIWTNYDATYDEARRLLGASNFDLSTPLPQVTYIQQEQDLGLIDRR